MASNADSMRRNMMMAMTVLPLTGAAASADPVRQNVRPGSATLVAYFSRSGNTRVVAGLIQRALAADLFEIQPARPYPDDYLATVEEARKERDSGRERALACKVPDIAHYETIFLGFPIWGETTPSIVRAFLSAHDLSGKVLTPFITHGGYGLGNSYAALARAVPKAQIQHGFVMAADQERRTMNQVNDWLKAVNA
ncbi:flavodoxin [Comamonas aquatica]|uniref:flavodoxin n=1 Tax=Comamonas aquatica TaxID=225991 RepID=UPI003CFC5969